MIDDTTTRALLMTVAARRQGASEAFDALYRECAPTLLGVALRIVRRRELAEEVLHDAFLKIWRNAARFDPMGAPVGWMVAIVRNRALDLVARHDHSKVDSYHASADGALEADPEGALDRLYSWEAPPEQSDEREQARAWLRGCLEGLQAPERQSLALAYIHGLSHGELAIHLDKPLGTVKTWIRRGMANLRTCVEACMGSRP